MSQFLSVSPLGNGTKVMTEIDCSILFENALAELEKTTVKSSQAFNGDQAAHGISEAVHGYKQRSQRLMNRLKPEQRRSHYADLLKAVTTTRKGYEKLIKKAELIDPLVWALEEPDWDGVEKDVVVVVAWLKAQEVLLKNAHTKASGIDGRKGREKSPGLGLFINCLANVWEKQTQKRVGISRRSETKSTQGGTVSGPFFRFVEKVIEAADLKHRSIDLGEFIADVLKQRDRQLAKDFRMPLLMEKYDIQSSEANS